MDIASLSGWSPIIAIHTASAVLALALGGAILFREKGTPAHRLLGRVWVGLMVVVAGSSLLITEARLIGPFSPIHALSVFTLFALWQGVRDARRGRIKAHRSTMRITYVASLVLAGAFTLVPGRRMHALLFGAEAGWTPTIVAMVLIFTATAMLWWRHRREPLPRA